MTRALIPLLLLCPLLAWTSANANESEPGDGLEPQRPRIGLVLSGGGAKGLAHVGVLRVLEEIRVPVDYIAGTSAGSAVAAMYALGMPVDEIEQRFINMNWKSSFQDTPGRHYQPIHRKDQAWRYPLSPGLGVRSDGFHLGRGLISGQNLGFILNGITAEAATVRDFDQLPIPFRAVATDLGTGEEVVIGQGDLAKAIRASMSIPGVYAPVELDGKLLVDGGIANNIPISVVRGMGADIIIAVDISDSLAHGQSLREAFSVVGQLTTMLTRTNALAQLQLLGDQDVLLQPDLEGLSSADFYKAPLLIEIGATTARAHASELHALAVDENEWQRYVERRSVRDFQSGPIVGIEVAEGSGRVSSEFIEARISQPIGEPLDVARLEEDLKRIYGLGYHETVGYRLSSSDMGSVLDLDAQEKSWGPNYLSFGLGFEDNFRYDTHFNASAELRMTGLNSRGGEWLTGVQLGTDPYVRSEWFQPLDYGFNRFITLGAQYERESFNLFEPGGQRVSEADISRRQVDLSAGLELGVNGEVRLRYARGYTKTEDLLGALVFQDERVDQGSVELRLVYDSMDDPFLPSLGSFAGLKGRFERPGLGADRDYDRVSMMLSKAGGWKNYYLIGSIYADVVTQGEAGYEDYILLGGFRRLTGFSYGEVSGQDAALVSLVGYRKFGGPFVPFFAGGAFEAGNGWDSISDARWGNTLKSWTLFAGIDSFLGPVQLSTSHSTQEDWTVTLNVGYYLGRLFD
ncbi:patatin-like phospholipase family protein [Marinobacter zhejiangensis]|uniref:NTE family protein n=1 Tax=Marinobacter zhejiangensis TaxID=488535 RepID=A0A1I4MEW4_9GAMM|nr:patatin-like phospholipase family protein [Marinobacter zhejiangensis]SFM01603.1 NTE family protein [Marinobacter zhejiangensis]